MSSRMKRVAMLGAAAALAATVGTAQAQTGGEGFGDFVWSDLNQNGIQDVGEPGLAGITVNLYRNGLLFDTEATGAAGDYLFSISEGASFTWLLEFVLPVGFAFSPADQGNDALDSDVIDAATGRTGSIPGVTLPFNAPLLTVDAGMYAVSRVPEPGSLPLITAGLFALLLTIRRSIARAKR
jgi:hypothetical protein